MKKPAKLSPHSSLNTTHSRRKRRVLGSKPPALRTDVRHSDFGFEIIFEALPDNVNWEEVAKGVAKYLCSKYELPLTGSQLKFIRKILKFSIRQFEEIMGVTKKTVIEWEKSKTNSTPMKPHTEVFFRMTVLKILKEKPNEIIKVLDMPAKLRKFEAGEGSNPWPIKIPKNSF